MIYYDIQHFGDPRWLIWLLRRLQHPANSFRLSYDAESEAVISLSRAIKQESIEALHLSVERSIPIRWCGPSQVRGLVHALRCALLRGGWEFFVNLSGSCFPLHSQEIIFNCLAELLSDGYSTHFSWFRSEKPATLPEEVVGLPQVRAKLGRLYLECNERLFEMFRDPNYFPVARVANRLLLHCTEPEAVAHLLNVSSLSPEELIFRQDYLARYPHHCGRAWFIFHRSDCEELVSFFDSYEFSDSARLFFSAFEPDESFIQTLVMNRLVLSPERIGKHSLRTFGGAPKIINDKNINLLNGQEKALFGRKIQHDQAENLLNLVEARTILL